MPQDNNPLKEIDSSIDDFIASLADDQAQNPETPAEESTMGEQEQGVTQEGSVEDSQETTGTPAVNEPSPAQNRAAPTPEVEMSTRLYIAQLENQILQMKAQTEKPAKEQETEPKKVFDDTPLFDEDAVKITPELEESYAAASPYIQAKILREIKAYDEKRFSRLKELETRLNQIDDVTKHQQAISTQATEEAFAASVRTTIPDLDSRVTSPGWNEYLNSPAPFSGGAFTVRQMLESAAGARNLNAVKEIVNGYKLPTNPMNQMAAPGKSQTSTPATTPRQQPKFAYSTYQKAADAVRLGTMTYEKFSEVEDAYLKAYEDNQVNFDS